MDGPRSRSLAQAEVLRELARVFPDPLIELAQFARTLLAGPPFDKQLNAWAKKWHLEALRDVAALHVYYWAGTPAAADQLRLVTPPATLPVVLLRPRPAPVIAGEDSPPVEWSPPMTWQPLEQIDPSNPGDPVVPHPDYESEGDCIERVKAAFRERAQSVRRPRQLRRHAEWFVRKHVQGWTGAQIEAAIAATTDGDAPDTSTILRAVRAFTKLLSTPDRH